MDRKMRTAMDRPLTGCIAPSLTVVTNRRNKQNAQVRGITGDAVGLLHGDRRLPLYLRALLKVLNGE
jgi:hypothetical protein